MRADIYILTGTPQAECGWEKGHPGQRPGQDTGGLPCLCEPQLCPPTHRGQGTRWDGHTGFLPLSRIRVVEKPQSGWVAKA